MKTFLHWFNLFGRYTILITFCVQMNTFYQRHTFIRNELLMKHGMIKSINFRQDITWTN